MSNTQDVESRRGADAELILNHPIYKEAWTAAEQALAMQRRKVGLRDADMHTRLIMAEQVLESVRRYIEDVVNTGRMADIQLQRSGSGRRWLGMG